MADVIRALTLWENLSSGSKVPELINVIVEIPKGSRNRYAYERKSGAFRLEGVLPQSLPVADIGIIPQSLYDDGSPLSVVVLTAEPTFPGCVIEAKPLGLLKIMEGGTYSDKVIAVPLSDSAYENVSELEDINEKTLALIAHFFAHSRSLEGAKVGISGWKGAEAAKKAVEHAVNFYKRKSGRS